MAHFSQLDALIKKMYFLKKNNLAHSKVVEVNRSFLRSLRPNFGFHLLFLSFHLKFLLALVLMKFEHRSLFNLPDLRRGS